MHDKRLALSVLAGGFGLGIVSLASPSIRDFIDGLLGIPQVTSTSTGDAIALRADLAAPALGGPLETQQSRELFQGLLYLLHDQYQDAAPILGKYAMLGDRSAQSAIGGMYYFGKGLPLDPAEGVRWLRLAAAQGDPADSETLAAAVNGTWEWEQSEPESEIAYAESRTAVPQYDLGANERTNPSETPRSAFSGSAASVMVPSGPPMGARASIDQSYGSDAASRRYSGPQASLPRGSGASPIILNRAGPGTYSDGVGDIYAQAGPHGVVNTRTGEFSPTN